MTDDLSAARRSGGFGALKSLYRGRTRDLVMLTAMALAALVGGVAEAGFLVVVTKVGLAATSGGDVVELFGDISVPTKTSIGLAAILLLSKVGAGVASGRLSSVNTSGTVARIRRELATSYLCARWDAQQSAGVGQLQDLLTSFTDKIGQMLGAVATLLISGLNLIALLILSFVVEPIATALVIVVVGALASILRPLRETIRSRAVRASALNLDFAGSLSEISDLGMEFHVFHVQNEANQKISELIEETRSSTQKLAFAQSLTPTVYTGLAYTAVLIGLGGVVFAGGSDVGSLGAVMLVMLRSLSYGQGVQVASGTLQGALPYFEVLEGRLAAFRVAERTDEGLRVPKIKQLTFEDVSFEYSPGVPVLTDLTFAIGPREVVGIIGPSGGGKSTLVQLILGLRSPTRGRVLLDGLDVGSLARGDLARKMTFVPQESHLFNGTVEENIRFMRPEITHEQIKAACLAANLWNDVQEFAEGLQRAVGDRGAHLSGGQRQRLCIARALVESPDVLILDEPTSALDVKSEQLIRDALTKLAERMTVIIVAHRLSTLEFCDRIMVVQAGKVVAFDSPEALERDNDFFREALTIAGMRPS